MAGSRAARQPGLRIGMGPGFDRIQWRVERFAWVVVALVIVLALPGLFGGGGSVMRATERYGDSEIHYNRLIRHEGLTQLDLTAPASGQEARVTFSERFLAGMRIEDVHPKPEVVQAVNQRVTYVFALAEGQDSADVTFTFRPERIGVHSVDIETGSGMLSFWQFALP